MIILYKIIFKLHALEHAQPAKQETQVTGACLSILLGSANIFAQKKDIVGMEKLTKPVMTVMAVELQVIDTQCQTMLHAIIHWHS